MYKKYHLLTTTEGCATNLLENATYRESLSSSGMEAIDSIDDADCVIVNTCAYTSNQEKRTTDLIKKLKSEHPNKEFIVGGCLTKINPEALAEVHTGASFDAADVNTLRKHLGLEEDKEVRHANFFDENDFSDLTAQHKFVLQLRKPYYKFEKILGREFQPLHNIFETVIINKEYFGITVSKGCAGKCSFCAIKFAKGYVQSKPIVNIMHEFQKGLSEGREKFWLLGDDIGCYGIDIQTDFSKLLDEILSIKKEFKLVINYFEPMFFLKYFEKMKEQLSDQRIVNFNLPIQSGNARIVRRMGREYDPKEVLVRLRELKESAPSLVVKTNIITGFPGETWSEYFDSVKSIFYFDAIYAIDFTSRPGTGAHKYKNHLPEPIKKIRYYFINFCIFFRHAYVFIKSLFNKKGQGQGTASPVSAMSR